MSFPFFLIFRFLEYKSPETEILAFNLAVERLVHIGYPEEVRKFKYDPIFPVRGVFLSVLHRQS